MKSRRISTSLKKSQHGFTLVETISVLIVTGLFSSLIVFFAFNYWRFASLLENDLDTFVNRLNAQDAVRELIGTSSGLMLQNTIPDSNAHNPDPISGATYWIEKHAIPGTTNVGTSGTTPVLYFKRPSVTTANTIAMNGELPYDDEYILYMNGVTKQLLLRTLANPNVVNNKAVTSCPPASATTSCPADRVLLRDVASIDSTFYSRSGNSINHQATTDPVTGEYTGPDFPVVEALQFTFRINKKALFVKGGAATVNETIVRIALRNT